MRLTVHMLTGKTLIIEADPSTEVKLLKANLYKHTGMNNEIRLMFGSTELLDAYSLGFYEIESDSDLQMIFQPDVFINISVQLLRKQTVSMRTKNSTSIAAFKANLWNFHNIKGAMHKHRLFYGDTELEDDLLPLHYYGINNGSILHLVGESVIKVTVINSRNQYGFVKMRLSETIVELKQKLSHSMKSTHVDTMLLFLKTDEDQFEELQDDATIEDYRIRPSDILHIITYKQWVTPIKIKVPGTDLSWIIRGIEHTKNSQDTVLSLKLLIQDQLDLPVDSQRLFASTNLCYESVETENSRRLGSYCKDSFRFYLKDETD